MQMSALLLHRRWRQEHRLLIIVAEFLPPGLQRLAHGVASPEMSRVSWSRLISVRALFQMMLGVAIGLGAVRWIPAFAFMSTAALLVGLFLPMLVAFASWKRVGVFPFAGYLDQAPIDSSAVARSMIRAEFRFLVACRSSLWWGVLTFAFVHVIQQIIEARTPAHFLSVVAAVVVFFCAVPGFALGSKAGVKYAKLRLMRRIGFAAFARYGLITAVSLLSGFIVMQILVVTTLDTARSVFRRVPDLTRDDLWENFGHGYLDSLVVQWLRITDKLVAVELSRWTIQALGVSTIVIMVYVGFQLWRSPPEVLSLSANRISSPLRFDFLRVSLRLLERSTSSSPILQRRFIRAVERFSWAIRPGFLGLIFPSAEAWIYLGGALAILNNQIETSTACFLLALVATFMIHNQATETRERLMPVMGPALDHDMVSFFLQSGSHDPLHHLNVARVRVHRWLLVPSTCCTITAGVLGAVLADQLLAGLCVVVAGITTMIGAPWVQWYMSPMIMGDGTTDRRHEQGSGSWGVEVQSTLQGWVRIPVVVVPGFLFVVVIIAGSLVPAGVSVFGTVLTIVGGLLTLTVLPHIARRLAKSVWSQGLHPRPFSVNGLR